jgi:pimeloyl-ACP methyl ester carboxylesterase
VGVIASLLPLAPAGAATGETSKPPKTNINWAACPEDPTAECGTLALPIDWAKPGGPTIDLALARRKATDPAARIGSLVINPGGPGGSGVAFALGSKGYFSEEITRRFDIVGFDPRGVARSHPIVCSTDLLLKEPSPLMTSQADFDARLAFNRQWRADCRAHTGPLYDHEDTLSVVRDLDSIRAALGDDKLSYYGVSYGTLIGQQYAETFPRRVRALSLDSNVEHNLGTRAVFGTEAVAAQDSFNEFVAWCDSEQSCALHGRDVRAVWSGLLTKARNGELRSPGDPDVPLTELNLIGMANGSFYGPGWATLAEALLALDTGAKPSPELVAKLSADPSTKPYAGPADDEPEVTQDPIPVFCQDFHLPMRDYQEYAAHMRRSAALAPDMRFSPLAVQLGVLCLGQPTPISNPQHHLRVHGSAPLLLGNAVHDPATAYSWAVGTARQLGRQATFLTYEGWGHGIYGRSQCTTGAIDGYLVSLTLPARGTRCPAVLPGQTMMQRQSLPRPSGTLPTRPSWTPLS